MFVLILSANSLSQDAKRKRLLAKDVFDALNDLELDFLIPPLHNALTGNSFFIYYYFIFFPPYFLCYYEIK